MLRYTVEAGNRPAALLSEEIGFVEDYLGVARERYETPLEFAYRGPRELLSLAVPPLLLQPLVENSLKHGCAPGVGAIHLELTVARVNGFIELAFADDGVTTSVNGPGLGTGLVNLEQRLRRFAGADVTMEAGARRDAEGGPARGFIVRLRWPVTKGATS
jgi:LytS/YehU family sensor histidine kinase